MILSLELAQHKAALNNVTCKGHIMLTLNAVYYVFIYRTVITYNVLFLIQNFMKCIEFLQYV